MKKHIKGCGRFKEIRLKKLLYNVGTCPINEYIWIFPKKSIHDLRKIRDYFNTLGGHDLNRPCPWELWELTECYAEIAIVFQVSQDTSLFNALYHFSRSEKNLNNWKIREKYGI